MKTFKSRVNHAVSVISNNRATNRNFDSCFEMHDGDEVVTALYRRAQKNEKLKSNLFKYIGEESCLNAVERLKNVPTKQLEAHSAATIEQVNKEFDEMMADWLNEIELDQTDFL